MANEETGHPAVAEFANALRELRRMAGNPSFNDLAKSTGIPRSTLHDAVSGKRLPAQKVALGLAAALDGDADEWRDRWIETDKARRPEVSEPAEPPEAAVPAVAPDTSATRPGWWRRHRLAVLASAAVVAAAGVAVPVAVAVTSDCTQVRDYTVTDGGAVLDDRGTAVGQVEPGDHLHAQTMDHGPFAHRRYGEVVSTGKSGYVDESKIDFTGTICT